MGDLPYAQPSQTTPEAGLLYVTEINQALAKHQITATGFVVGQQINRRSRKALQAFVDAGHSIGNHTWSHPDYGTLTSAEFRKEVSRTDRVLQRVAGKVDYFRFPYLREGESQTSKRLAEEILAEFNYSNVPATIDNDEWKFNAEYVAALSSGDVQIAEQVAESYFAYMKAQTLHFDQMAKSHFGREVKHILLLHMNRINADHLATLLDWYAENDWQFITVDQALKDPLFTAPDLYIGPKGLSQIERVIGHKID
ncbi:MAG: polysaccharide deacetylase family protein [Cognatishimia sp.]